VCNTECVRRLSSCLLVRHFAHAIYSSSYGRVHKHMVRMADRFVCSLTHRWFVSERYVEKFPELASYRGLHSAAVLDYFNRTLYSIGEPDHAYGLEQTRLLIHFGFDIRIQFRTSEEELQARLEAGLPTLFFLWTPHGFTNLFNLSRIDLPRYRDEEAFLKGQTGTSERASQGMLPAS
jgi:hypothetical protein